MQSGPFIGSRAVRRGELTRHALVTRYRPVYRDVYVSTDTQLTAALRARAAGMSTGATLVGISAAAVHGTKWLDAEWPAEIARNDRHSQPGIIAHSWSLAPSEVCRRDGLLVTTPVRTAFDIGRTISIDRAIPVVDALCNVTGLAPADVAAFARTKAGMRGVRQLSALLQLVDGGAESPQESRLRVVLVRAGLPFPQTQIEFHDDYGEVIIRVDMGWPQWRVAVEYDGVQHWTDARQRAWDIERLALLEAAGWVVVRVSAGMLRHPGRVVERVAAALRARGCAC